MAPADISVVRDCGQYYDSKTEKNNLRDGIAIKLFDRGEEINELFIYDMDVPVFLAETYHALTQSERATLAQIIDAEEVAP